VEQLNMFRNFVGKGKIDSISVPFRCEKCNYNFSRVFDIDSVRKFEANSPTVACTKCQGESRFDDLPDEYFEFLKRCK
jgi:hypothetical protein